jgi:hypothetical protein
MPQPTRTRLSYDIHVISASPAASLAATSIAGILGIEPRLAADRLASLPALLAEKVTASVARRLSALLSALGMRIRLDPTLSCPDSAGLARRRDLAIQAMSTADRLAIVARLGPITDRTEAEILSELSGPEGFVLRDLGDEAIVRIQRLLRRQAGLRLLASDPRTAVYDGYPGAAQVPLRELARLGLGRCSFSGAVASGVNRATMSHLERRIPGRLHFLNRDFVRFDLFLTGAQKVEHRELAGFLETRGQVMPESPDHHRCIDSDLPYAIAEQFIADYAAIGLDVFARLRGIRSRNLPGQPG